MMALFVGAERGQAWTSVNNECLVDTFLNIPFCVSMVANLFM